MVIFNNTDQDAHVTLSPSMGNTNYVTELKLILKAQEKVIQQVIIGYDYLMTVNIEGTNSLTETVNNETKNVNITYIPASVLIDS
ncbi:hypothetical protein MD535_23795 [Vibrio sp. ZSDZ65]|uniref:Uncharacterized protein n=1 Tax=Vibrio qingdaonensis TaxID=2829491 RepID=A0A9X3CSS9_9VIBR|nr:hypothetical protein [Vibrio qingdaonensis]MCW8349018.1 hypothetical protein [Vibrio qingdaonensis]